MKFIKRVLCVLVFVAFGVTSWSQTLTPYEFRVEGMCGMCQDRIETTAKEKGGADWASWDVVTKVLKVLIDETVTNIDKVRTELAMAGHDNGKYIAPDEVYKNMHTCCKYRPDEDEKDHEQSSGNDKHEHEEDKSPVHQVEGHIYGIENGKKMPLIGANILLEGTDIGTTTDFDGYFSLDNSEAHSNAIEVTFIGFNTRTLSITDDGVVEIILDMGHELETVEITYKKRTTEVSFLKPLNIESITQEELCKAACCNLSESFETNPSVDASFTDAITGTRQIQMLGLAGPYVQLTRELIPDVRAMSSIYGLSMTPGPWIESIQLIKGVGSVVNGYESITGQINVELKKPEAGDLMFLNGFANNGGRFELNANMRKDLSDFVSTGLLLHGKMIDSPHDKNKDGFTDKPLEKDFIIGHRWRFEPNSKNGFQGQVGVKMTSLDHEGGTFSHFAGTSQDHENHWQMYNDTKRYEAWTKIGYVNPESPQHSVGLQLSGVLQNQDSEFGGRIYDSEQRSAYANLIYQYLKQNHIIRTGLTLHIDDITEDISDLGSFVRSESVPGAYIEYTYKDEEKLAIIPGLRVDHHSNYGTMVTPRLHAKYNFSDNSVIRLVGGKGWRTASVFAENLGMFSTSRIINLETTNPNNPYGLEAEEAWNYGINYTQGIDVAGKELILSMDFYRTDFKNQIVVDYETPGTVSLYNLEGESYSNSFQTKVEYEIIKNLDVRAAYRLFDVKTDYQAGLLQKPLVAKHRAFVNFAYTTENDWLFDATVNWNGQKRLPFTESNPEPYRRAESSPDFMMLNAQITKRWNDKWDVYLGGENLLNYKQEDAIIAGDDPFGPYFDASIVYAPLFGANVYIGFRMRIQD